MAVFSTLAGCADYDPEELAAVDFAPQVDDAWQVSNPRAQGLDPNLLARLYLEASESETLHGLLVIRNGSLVAEGYFNGSSAEKQGNVQSVTKSYVSALMGVALAQGCINSVDQKMLDFFPEHADKIQDPRKRQITIRHLLQMRAGYPWEEGSKELWEALWAGSYLPMIVHFPLVREPGTGFEYSNMTSDWLGMIIARACETDLRSLAEEHLLGPLGTRIGKWVQDVDGYYIGHGEIHATARDIARFGLLYLNKGTWGGERIISAGWVEESLNTYSEDVWDHFIGSNIPEIGYGYHWWSARSGGHKYNFAWGHGGQLVFVIDALDMVIVTTADPLHGQIGSGPWSKEKAIINLVADFIASLPGK